MLLKKIWKEKSIKITIAFKINKENTKKSFDIILDTFKNNVLIKFYLIFYNDFEYEINNEYLIRQFLKDGENIILKPYSSDFGILRFDSTMEIIGVAIELFRDLE